MGELNIKIPNKLSKEIEEYCKVNNIENVNDFILKILKKGFDLEKWGDININDFEVEKIELPIEKKETIMIPEKLKIIKKKEVSKKIKVKQEPNIQSNNDIYGDE